MQRFFLPTPVISDGIVEIHDSRIIFQATKMLRLKTGSRFSIFDEDGRELLVEILEINRRKILANVLEELERKTEPSLEVHLYQAIPKKTALFEWVIQKATELGVSHIYPLVTQRTEKHRLSKFERMHTIAIEATEQSRRLKVPVIHHPVFFEDVIKKVQNGYLAYEYENTSSLSSFLDDIRGQKTVHLFIGPEGGFKQMEIDLAITKGIKPFSLGPRILHTETAAISALSIILLS